MGDLKIKLLIMVREGIALIKEDAVMCLSTVAEIAGEEFKKHYNETVEELMGYLNNPTFTAE